MKESTKQIGESLRCNYTVFEKDSDPDLLEKAYREALERGRAEGFYPAVLLVDQYVAEWLLEVVKEDYNREELISGCSDNGKHILEERFKGYMEDLTEDFGEEEMEQFIGNETEGEKLDHFIGYISFSNRMLEDDALLLEIPVENPWEVVAYLPMGGWNECPDPEEMMDICKYWYEKYKAIPAVFTHDVMEFYAPLGLNGADSLEAAKEQYAFCPDRVDQGTRTYKISELAAGLEDSHVWYFWWD